jgi:hypothetical protein
MHRSAIDVSESIPVMCNKAPPPPEPMAPVEWEESLLNHGNLDYSQQIKCFTAYDAHDISICSGSEK